MNPPLYVEVTALLAPHLTGIGRFVVRLIEALAEEGPLRLTVTPPPDSKRCQRWDIPVSADILPAGEARQWVSRVLRLPREPHDPIRSRESPMLYTWLRPDARHFRRELCIIYDFTPLITPQYHLKPIRDSFGTFFGGAVSLCDSALAISESTQHDARWLSAIDPSRVFAQHPGPSQCVHRHAHRAPVKRRDDLIVVVATLEPRKNASFVLDWFFKTRVLSPKTQLCWVGPPGWLPALGAKATGPAARRIHFPGVVSDEVLCRLYQEATFTIYPSLYEGFGFPVLDSLWHGCPVLSSYHSSLTEFESPGVYFFDPCDPATLDEAWVELQTSSERLCIERDELARRFSWGALARTVRRLAFEDEGCFVARRGETHGGVRERETASGV